MAERFNGLTSNGPLPGGEMGHLQRRLLSNAGITPTVHGERRLQDTKRSIRKQGKWIQVTKGVRKWVPDK